MSFVNGLARVSATVAGRYAVPETIEYSDRAAFLTKTISDLLPNYRIDNGCQVGTISFELFAKRERVGSWRGSETNRPDMIRMRTFVNSKPMYRKVHVKKGGLNRKEFAKKFDELWELTTDAREKAEVERIKEEKLRNLSTEMRQIFGKVMSSSAGHVYARTESTYYFYCNADKETMLAIAEALGKLKEKKNVR